MTQKLQLDQAVASRVDELLGSAGERGRAGEMEASVALALQAWDLLPEPKDQWDFYPQIMSINMINDYVALGDAPATKKWVESAYRMYGDVDRRNHYVLMQEGSSLLKLGLEDEAYAVFSRIHDLFGRKGFKGEQLEFLEFFLKRRSRSDG